ncbi:Hsp20/alpha crystallin family protein [Taibaiella helva]|uniref:Hsp20/alpha crystallin family protein n=1 Tax=Taibaiella helva TaxID=2301235 RepID=UPI000E58BCB8|nr:Hsp20/alpha crystallin family protein [Taibaiella helva]
MSKHSLINLREILPETTDDFFASWNEWFRRNFLLSRMTVPALNMSDNKDQYKVTVAAPGLEKEDFDIEVEDNVLTISATSEREHDENKKKYRHKEYSYSSFSRSFTLPADVRADGIDATYDNGILTLKLPKNEAAKPAAGRKVKVK